MEPFVCRVRFSLCSGEDGQHLLDSAVEALALRRGGDALLAAVEHAVAQLGFERVDAVHERRHRQELVPRRLGHRALLHGRRE